MCVGYTNGYEDFESWRLDAALKAMVPGSAVAFDRRALYHFAIFLGWAWPLGGGAKPLPLLCHLSGSPDTKPRASVRLEDVRDVAQGCTVRVYRCHCDAAKRALVVNECLARIGETGYNLVTNNCEHFVRSLIHGQRVSYQTRWTLALPVLQLPRLAIGLSTVVRTVLTARDHRRLQDDIYLGLIDPESQLLMIKPTRGGLNVTVQLATCCTRMFTGANAQAAQQLHHCITCRLIWATAICENCVKTCHKSCETRRLETRMAGFCQCHCCL
uniref:LRAT domain-containing protein n=2 Tax=Macrostomum lignano TaxID=282301 RepID=A0A1I8J5A6_9PLAT